MTVSTPIQFKWNPSIMPTSVVPFLKEKLRVINTDPHNQKEKGLIPVPTPRGKTMWVYPDIVQSQQWMTVLNRKSKGKAKASSSNIVSISTRETREDVASITQKMRNPPLLLTQAHLTYQRLDLASIT